MSIFTPKKCCHIDPRPESNEVFSACAMTKIFSIKRTFKTDIVVNHRDHSIHIEKANMHSQGNG